MPGKPVTKNVLSLSRRHFSIDFNSMIDSTVHGYFAFPCESPLTLWSNLMWSYCAVPLILYGLQHYLSIIGSLILIPLVIVPAMGGSSVSTSLWLFLSLEISLCIFTLIRQWCKYMGCVWGSHNISTLCYAERYSEGYFKHVHGLRDIYITTLPLWLKVTPYTRSFICLSRSISCYHFLAWLHQH